MKTKYAIFAFVLATAMSALASATTITGVLTDDMCKRKHMMPGKSNADCVRECLKHGAKLMIVSEGKAVEVQGKQLNDLAGKRVTLTGEMKGKVLVVTTASVAQ